MNRPAQEVLDNLRMLLGDRVLALHFGKDGVLFVDWKGVGTRKYQIRVEAAMERSVGDLIQTIHDSAVLLDDRSAPLEAVRLSDTVAAAVTDEDSLTIRKKSSAQMPVAAKVDPQERFRRRADYVLTLLLAAKTQDEIIGDLSERFRRDVGRHGMFHARLFLIRHGASAVIRQWFWRSLAGTAFAAWSYLKRS